MQGLDSREFRRILGHYPTGVCVVTARGAAGPIGMAVGSFTSVSLDPPLVAFLPDRRSSTWPLVEAAGAFCVNVLAAHQQPICAAFSRKGGDRFAGIAHRPSPHGLPIIAGGVAWIDCALHAVHEAGDHFIVLGRVRAMAAVSADAPLVFVQGGYGAAVRAAA